MKTQKTISRLEIESFLYEKGYLKEKTEHHASPSLSPLGLETLTTVEFDDFMNNHINPFVFECENGYYIDGLNMVYTEVGNNSVYGYIKDRFCGNGFYPIISRLYLLGWTRVDLSYEITEDYEIMAYESIEDARQYDDNYADSTLYPTLESINDDIYEGICDVFDNDFNEIETLIYKDNKHREYSLKELQELDFITSHIHKCVELEASDFDNYKHKDYVDYLNTSPLAVNPLLWLLIQDFHEHTDCYFINMKITTWLDTPQELKEQWNLHIEEAVNVENPKDTEDYIDYDAYVQANYSEYKLGIYTWYFLKEV